MTNAATDISTPPTQHSSGTVRSRRALLAGAAGGLAAAAAASMLARPGRALAADGDPVVLGQDNEETVRTRIINTSADEVALVGLCDAGVGLRGRSLTGQGVQGFSSSSAGVQGFSETDAGVNGFGGPFGVWATGDPYGGFFVGAVFTNQFYELELTSVPPAPDPNRARLFIRNQAGKAQLCVRFSAGPVRVLATEP